MDIEHLVISGGGPVFGLYVYGILNQLCSDDKINIDKIKSIYGCSAGSILGALLCLKFDWKDLTDYIVRKPWDKIVNIEPEDIFSVSNDKGILDRKFFEEIFSTLLLAKDLDVNITLKQLYEYSNIDLHIYTSKINTFEYIDISHSTYPDMSIIDAVNMSSAIPFIFKPVKYDDSYFIDGCVIKNFPFDEFIENNMEVPEEKILAISLELIQDVVDCSEMSLMNYASFIYRNQMILLDKQKHIAKFNITVPLSSSDMLDFIQIFKNSAMREDIINEKSIKIAHEQINKFTACQNQ